MGIALFSAAALINSLNGVIGWLAPREQSSAVNSTMPKVWRRPPAARTRMVQASPLQAHAGAHHPVSLLPCNAATRQVARVARAPRATASPARALRVVRVMDAASSAGAGRMVISGRMADVCAELDRLAALEASNAPVLALN